MMKKSSRFYRGKNVAPQLQFGNQPFRPKKIFPHFEETRTFAWTNFFYQHPLQVFAKKPLGTKKADFGHFSRQNMKNKMEK